VGASWSDNKPPRAADTFDQEHSSELYAWTQSTRILGPVYLASEDRDLYSQANVKIDPRIPTDDYEILADMVEDLIHEASGDCRLFLADKVTLGTGLPGLMAGDIVCVLFGGNVPYILRSTGVEGQYLCIGECYVQELMDGQALEMGLPEQKFTLV